MGAAAVIAGAMVGGGIGTGTEIGCARNQESTRGSLGGTVTTLDASGSPLSVMTDANSAQIGADSSTLVSPSAANSPLFNDAGEPISLALDPFLGKHPTAGKSIGHTSVAFKLTFDGGNAAAFKPTSHRGGMRWKGEVAAYRLGVALGLPNVPPAFAHALDATTLRAALEPAARDLYDGEVPVSTSAGPAAAVATSAAPTVEGALIPWIHDLEFPAVERDPLFTIWTTALRHDSPLPPPGSDDAALAAQMSTVVLFDLLDGNWDRWSGGNMGKQKGSSVYLYIDNDGAFYAHPPQKTLDRGWARLSTIDRFSRGFVARLRAIDVASVLAASADNRAGIDAAIVKSVDDRRTKILAAIDDKIKRYGDEDVLVFP